MKARANYIMTLAGRIRHLMDEVKNERIGPDDTFVLPATVDLTLREARELIAEALVIMEDEGWSTGDDTVPMRDGE